MRSGVPEIAGADQKIERNLREIMELCGDRPDRLMVRYLAEQALDELGQRQVPPDGDRRD